MTEGGGKNGGGPKAGWGGVVVVVVGRCSGKRLLDRLETLAILPPISSPMLLLFALCG